MENSGTFSELAHQFVEKSSFLMQKVSDSFSALGSEKGLADPNVLISIILLASAGVILLLCMVVFATRRRQNFGPTIAHLDATDSRITSLEIILQEHKNLIGAIKNQNRSDLGFLKQEISQLQSELDELRSYSYDTVYKKVAS